MPNETDEGERTIACAALLAQALHGTDRRTTQLNGVQRNQQILRTCGANWNLGTAPAQGHVVNEPALWTRYGLTFPVQSKQLKDVATMGPDGIIMAYGRHVRRRQGNDSGSSGCS